MKSETSQPLHKGCNSSTCCSPAKLWRTLQTLVKNDDKKGLIQFFKDDRLEHIVRVALTSRITNDASLYPPSQQHKVIRLTSRDALLCLGKSYTDLNLLQLALLTSSESTVVALLAQLKAHTTQAELKHFVNHIWGGGNTSLHLAVFLKRHLVVKILLNLGCSPETHKNARNKYASDCCLGDESMLALFMQAEKKPNKLPESRSVPVTKEEQQDIKEQESNTIQEDTRSPINLAVKYLLDRMIPHDFIIDKKNLSILVQPNHCIALAQHKKPPDICNTILTC